MHKVKGYTKNMTQTPRDRQGLGLRSRLAGGGSREGGGGRDTWK